MKWLAYRLVLSFCESVYSSSVSNHRLTSHCAVNHFQICFLGNSSNFSFYLNIQNPGRKINMHILVHKHKHDKRFHSAATFLLFPPFTLFMCFLLHQTATVSHRKTFSCHIVQNNWRNKTDWLKREENQWNRQQLWSEWGGWGVGQQRHKQKVPESRKS